MLTHLAEVDSTWPECVLMNLFDITPAWLFMLILYQWLTQVQVCIHGGLSTHQQLMKGVTAAESTLVDR